MGTWIEMALCVIDSFYCRVVPSWARGLKSVFGQEEAKTAAVVPSWARGLKCSVDL